MGRSLVGASTRAMWAEGQPLSSKSRGDGVSWGWDASRTNRLNHRTSETNHHYLFTAAQRSHNLERERTQLGQMSKHLASIMFPPLSEQELIGLCPEKRGPLGSVPHQLRPRPLGPSPLPTHTAWTCPTSRLAGPWGSTLGPSHSSYSVCIALGLLMPRILAERSPLRGRCSWIPATGFVCHHVPVKHLTTLTSNPTPVWYTDKCHLSLLREGRAHGCLVKFCCPGRALGHAGRGPPGLLAVECLLQPARPLPGRPLGNLWSLEP